jgi:hypothetical protein
VPHILWFIHTRMLPDFNDDGNLPPGIHRATIEEVIARFGQGSQERHVEGRELIDFVKWARQSVVIRMLVNGSFVTDTMNPNDVDVVILPSSQTIADPRFGQLGDAAWPFLHIFVAADEADFRQWAEGDFGTDRRGHAKGVVEIIL